MKKPELNTLNFQPSSESGQWSIVFWLQGKYRERRFDDEVVATKFKQTWEAVYSDIKYSHREITEWVYMSLDPMYLRVKQDGELVEL